MPPDRPTGRVFEMSTGPDGSHMSTARPLTHNNPTSVSAPSRSRAVGGIGDVGAVPGVESYRRRLSDRPWSLRAKRALDLIVAGVAVLVAVPVFLVIALAIVTTSPGPVFFRQWRVGRNGERFRIWKFRTMYADAEERLGRDLALHAEHRANGFKFAPGEDPRITRVGRWLRRTSLDELPQVLNVFRGHMSLVGPRPVVADELDSYADNVRAYLAVQPGITGAWQVNGRSNIAFPERGEMDADYVRHWTLWRDVKILVRTVPAVLRKTGAH